MSFPAKLAKDHVADASVVINLNATSCAERVLTALPGALVVTENARVELEAGLRSGHDDAARLDVLIRQGAVRVVRLGSTGIAVYESLIEGATELTLDDGEAATIAYAFQTDCVAVLDERKARRICAERFPKLAMSSSAELLMCDSVGRELGLEAQTTAVINALQQGRMRVPPAHVPAVVALIGEANAARCGSLPKAAKAVVADKR